MNLLIRQIPVVSLGAWTFGLIEGQVGSSVVLNKHMLNISLTNAEVRE